MNRTIQQHPLMNFLQSATVEEIAHPDSIHPLALDLVGDEPMSDADAIETINNLIRQFKLDEIELIK